MPHLKNYECKYDVNSLNIYEIGRKSGLKFPSAYTETREMALLSKAVQSERKTTFCYLPFCHTVEAEALGACVVISGENAGPMVKTYAYNDINKLSTLPEPNFNNGRIKNVLGACKILSDEDNNVALMVSGPFTVLSSLVDIGQIIKGWRKSPELMTGLFDSISDMLIHYINESVSNGVKLFSYADPVGALNIIGADLAEAIAFNFTAPFLCKANEVLDGSALIHLCPKTHIVLKELNLVRCENIKLPYYMSYEEACVYAYGKVGIVSGECIQNSEKFNGAIQGIYLKNEINEREI